VGTLGHASGPVPTLGGITQARQRLGYEPVRDLFATRWRPPVRSRNRRRGVRLRREGTALPAGAVVTVLAGSGRHCVSRKTPTRSRPRGGRQAVVGLGRGSRLARRCRYEGSAHTVCRHNRRPGEIAEQNRPRRRRDFGDSGHGVVVTLFAGSGRHCVSRETPTGRQSRGWSGGRCRGESKERPRSPVTQTKDRRIRPVRRSADVAVFCAAVSMSAVLP
jgi:hypothetical protein